MNKKIILALLGLALGSCGGTPTSSSIAPAGSSDTQSTPGSDSSSAPASSDSSVTPSSSDSGQTPSSSDSGVTPSSSDSGDTPSSSDSGSDASSGTGTGSTDAPTEERKEKIIDFLTKDNGGLTEGEFVADVDILNPLAFGFDGTKTCQNILQFQNMTVLYNVSDKKVYNGIWGGVGFSIGVGKGIAAYEELSEMMGPAMLPAPEGIDVATEEGAIAYCKYFFEFISRQSGQEITFNCEKKGDYYTYSLNEMSGLTQSTYVVESADHLDFYTYTGEGEKYVHGSAPLGTETIHGVYRSPLGSFIQYARTHLEKVSAAIVEEGVGLLKIKFSELAKDPEAAEVKIFGGAGLSYVPDMSVSFDNSGSIHGFNGSLEIEGREVKVEALIRNEDTLPITVPTNAVECEHSGVRWNTFEDEQGGGHYRYCAQCNSVLDYGPHEYHEGDEHCHACDYVETVEAPFKQDAIIPAALSELKILESKAHGNFIDLEGVDGYYRGTSGEPFKGNYRIVIEGEIKDEEHDYRIRAVGSQPAAEAKGCMYPMHFVVTYAECVDGVPGTQVVIYEKTCDLEYHKKTEKVVEGMGDACHVYKAEECQICHQEYGFPELTLSHDPKMKENQDGSYTVTCAKCNESAILEIGDSTPEDETGHKVAYNYVSGSREIYEFFVEHNTLQDHDYVYKDGVGTCTVCGYETTRKQVVVDLSSYVGEAAKITLFLDKDRGEQAIAKASNSLVMHVDAVDPDTEQTRSGYALVSHPDVFVAVEPVETHVPETTCQYTVEWQIGVYRVQYDEETDQFVLDGELLDTCEDPWDPAEVKHHQHMHETYTPTGEGCVYDGKFVCDACGEIVDEFTISLHEISVSKENEAYRLTCEHCHASVLVDSYLVEKVTNTYHAYRIKGSILEASSSEFEKEAAKGIFTFHEFDDEGNCACGDHREDKMTNYVWAHNLFSEDPIDVAGGVRITRDETGKATAATLYGQDKGIDHNAESSFEEWSYKAVDSSGNAIGLIHVKKDFVPYEDHLVMSEHSFSLSLTDIEGDVSQYALINHDAQTPDYKTFGVLIAYELSGESKGVAGRINFQYKEEGGSKMLSGISYEGVGAAISSLTKIEEPEEGQRIDIKAFQIVDTDGNGLNYCFISEEYQHLEGEEWVGHETHYYIADFDPDNPASDISYMDLREVAFH